MENKTVLFSPNRSGWCCNECIVEQSIAINVVEMYSQFCDVIDVVYGLTEVTVVAACGDDLVKHGSCGQPASNVTIKVGYVVMHVGLVLLLS